jgi:hypothetical protein
LSESGCSGGWHRGGTIDLSQRLMAWSGDLTTRRGAVFLDQLALDPEFSAGTLD